MLTSMRDAASFPPSRTRSSPVPFRTLLMSSALTWFTLMGGYSTALSVWRAGRVFPLSRRRMIVVTCALQALYFIWAAIAAPGRNYPNASAVPFDTMAPRGQFLLVACIKLGPESTDMSTNGWPYPLRLQLGVRLRAWLIERRCRYCQRSWTTTCWL